MKKIVFAISVSLLAVSLTALAALAASAQDTKNPDDVENLNGTALDGAAKLTWHEATDDVGIDGYQIHYGLNSVTEKGQTYDKSEDAGNVTEYVVEGLKNGEKYYFAVIAYDAAGNESIAWSNEASVTPEAGAGSSQDTDAPTVNEAEAVNSKEVKVVFSEAIVLPQEDPQDAFGIENNDTFEPLAITAAIMDEDDDSGKSVILSTDEQEADVEYKLTVGIAVKDKSGNPIISGTSDTAVFDGSGEAKEPEDGDGPEIKKVEVIDNTHIGVQFTETVVLGIDPSANFQINQETDQTKELGVLGVKLGQDSGGVSNAYAILTTEAQEDTNYVVIAVDVKDETGNAMNAGKNSAVFEGKAVEETDTGEEPGEEPPAEEPAEEPAEDTVAPEDVANFLAEAMVEAQKYIVKLTWKLPEETDSVKQNLYLSKDKGESYETVTNIGAALEIYEMKDVEPGDYWMKLTQEDEAGNESEGAVIEVILSETGPGIIGLVLASLGLGRVVTRRKKR